MSNKIIEKMDLFYYCTMLVTGLGKLTVLGHRVTHYFLLYNYFSILSWEIFAESTKELKCCPGGIWELLEKRELENLRILI